MQIVSQKLKFCLEKIHLSWFVFIWTSIGFSMNYTKFSSSLSKMNKTIMIFVLQIDVEKDLTFTSAIFIPFDNFYIIKH